MFTIKHKRQNDALQITLDEIKKWKYFDIIKAIMLYGSCARGTERWGSDIDVLVILNKDTDSMDSDIKDEVNNLKYVISKKCRAAEGENLIEVDLSFILDGPMPQNNAFLHAIKREGVVLWHT